MEIAVNNTVSTPLELLAKLERTFWRRVNYGDDQLDWAFDFAVTAWHLVDWLAAETGTKLGAMQLSCKDDCPPLAVCEQLCNGYKHFELNNPKLQGFRVDKDVVQSAGRAGVSRPGLAGSGDFSITLTPQVLVTDRSGTTWDALTLFIDVVRYWRTKLDPGSGRAL